MSTLDTGLTFIRNASQRVSRANGWMGNAFKSWMPTGLYARALLIMIVPMVILQTVVAFVFMERHWNTVTRRLSAAVVQDIAGLIDIYKALSAGQGPRAVAPHRAAAAARGRFSSRRRHAAARAKTVLLAARPDALGAVGRQIGRPFWIDTVGKSNLVEIRIQLDDSVMRVFAQRSAAYASNSEIFIFWMLGTSSILLDRRGLVPAQPDQADPAAGRGRRKLWQGARGAKLPSPRRTGSAAARRRRSWK